MTGPGLGKVTATASEANGSREVSASPLQWSDKCFLCGRGIGESDPRSFYMGSFSMALCHLGCLNIMNANGGKPADFHRATETQSVPVPQEKEFLGPGWLHFDNFHALQAYITEKGQIPEQVKVTVGEQLIQPGE